ncbi:hypothetical protein ACFPJ7_20155, partial [Brachybacterium fresconis]
MLAAIAFNLTRAAGVLASTFHARARWTTLLDHLIAVPARIANRARSWRLHLPRNWPWQTAWENLFDLTCTGLVCQCVEDVSGVVGEVGLRGDLLPGQGDRDVLQRAE